VLHLEDLVVNQEMRGKQLGTKLLDQVVVYGHQLGVKRISWDVLDWNEDAIQFYEKKGAHVMRDWNLVQLNEEGIKAYLSKI
ncbi:MAG: GNAT family N-acetyltransferase, partial [Xanthomarina sp.]